MNMRIDQLNVELPESLGARKHSILRLVRQELMRFDWPEAEIEKFSMPTISISSQQTNLSIARSIVKSLVVSVRKQKDIGRRLVKFNRGDAQ
jgi:hypothetical protein